jgi:ferric-dicitrate binding protein FerR (iron transport regulator)
MQKMGINTQGFMKDDDEPVFIETPKSGKRIVKKMMLATCVAAAVVAAAFFYHRSTENNKVVAQIPSPSIISTKYGSKTSVTLPDGTKVWINSGSKLTYDNDFGTTAREVNLTGEAFFDVTHNAEKPFIIHTSKMSIRVLGTAFNVRCYDDEEKIETSLIRGRIEVTLNNKPDKKIYLNPADKLILMNDEIVEAPKPSASPSIIHPLQQKTIRLPLPEEISIQHITYQPADSSVVETSWVDNRLAFVGDTFEEVAKKMEKWYGVHITITHKKLKQTKLTGAFEDETIEQALKALQITTPFNYINYQNNIIITK